MTYQDVQDQALKLSDEERWRLVNVLLRSLKPAPKPTTKRQGLAASLIGIAKTDAPPPSDEEVRAMLDERLAEKYL